MVFHDERFPSGIPHLISMFNYTRIYIHNSTQWINKQIIWVCVFHFIAFASTLNLNLINCGSQDFPLRKVLISPPFAFVFHDIGVVFQLGQEEIVKVLKRVVLFGGVKN